MLWSVGHRTQVSRSIAGSVTGPSPVVTIMGHMSTPTSTGTWCGPRASPPRSPRAQARWKRRSACAIACSPTSSAHASRGAPPGLDRDDLDAFCHHLLVRERQSGALVGTYRILPAERARSAGGFLRGAGVSTCAGSAASGRSRGGRPRLRASRLPERARHCAPLGGAAPRVNASGSRQVMGCASVSLADGHAPAAAICGRLCEQHLGPNDGGSSPPAIPTRDGRARCPSRRRR